MTLRLPLTVASCQRLKAKVIPLLFSRVRILRDYKLFVSHQYDA